MLSIHSGTQNQMEWYRIVGIPDYVYIYKITMGKILGEAHEKSLGSYF